MAADSVAAEPKTAGTMTADRGLWDLPDPDRIAAGASGVCTALAYT